MQNIRYNPLFGTGDASSDAVNPVFGVARSNPLYGLGVPTVDDIAEESQHTIPDDILASGLGTIWLDAVERAGISFEEGHQFFINASSSAQDEILQFLETARQHENIGEEPEYNILIDHLASMLREEETQGGEEELADPPREEEIQGGEEELVGPPRIATQTPFQEYITAQGLEPFFNMMNILLGNEGKHLSSDQFNLAYDMQIPELSTLVEGLEVVMESEAVAFGNILKGEIDISGAGARLQGMDIAMNAAKTILSYFAQASTDQGPFRDLPPNASAGGWQEPDAWVGEPNHDYGEYQGIAAAGYGTAAPTDFQGELEAAWDVLAGHGISADEYEAMADSDKEMVLEYAQRYEFSQGADVDALENMVAAAFSGLSSEELVDVFDVPLATTTADRVEVLRDGFSRAFPFYDIVDQPIYELLQTTIGEIERASGYPVTAERLAAGLSAFRNVGFTSYRPDVLVSVLTNVCAKFANPDEIVMDVLSSDAFCSPERIANAEIMFGSAAAQKFIEFCEMDVAERMVEVELNNFDIAQMLDIRGSDLDKKVLEQLNAQVASNPEPKQLLEDVRRVLAPEVVSPVRRTVVPKTDSKVANNFGDSSASKGPSKIAAVATLGITAVALGFLANKLRKL